MRRYLVLLFVGILAFGTLFVFYQKSESTLTKNHHSVLNLFITAKQVEATLEKDLLKSRNFLLLTYDPIVTNEKEVDQICADFRAPENALYKAIDGKLDLAIEDYCQTLDQKMKSVEVFKSRNAILRNSIYFMQKTALEEVDVSNLQSSQELNLQRKLIKLSLAYALVSSPESKKALNSVISTFKSLHLREASIERVGNIALHSTKIFEIKETLDSLTNEIVNSNSAQFLESVRQIYFQHYSKSESTAAVFRELLFAACALFLGFVLFNILLLWKAAINLKAANANLEQRVLDRTKELRESQETIIQQQEALVSSAKLSSLGEMAGGVAHEINTPLAIIGLRVEQLEECIADGSMNQTEVIETLEVIKKTSNRIAKIIAGLRFFARDGKTMPTLPTLVVEVINETVSFCQEKFANHGVQLEIQNGKDTDMQIDCRSVEISQVLLNLLNNAFDAIENKKEKWIRVGVVDKNEFVELTVTDSGSGIPKDLRDKIMQPFFTTKDIGKGTGLGLSISRGIIESHQGKFGLDINCPNTCFTVLLPKKQKQPEVTKESA